MLILNNDLRSRKEIMMSRSKNKTERPIDGAIKNYYDCPNETTRHDLILKSNYVITSRIKSFFGYQQYEDLYSRCYLSIIATVDNHENIKQEHFLSSLHYACRDAISIFMSNVRVVKHHDAISVTEDFDRAIKSDNRSYDQVDAIMARLEGREITIVAKLAEGYKMSEVAKIVGVSRSRIYILLDNIRIKLEGQL